MVGRGEGRERKYFFFFTRILKLHSVLSFLLSLLLFVGVERYCYHTTVKRTHTEAHPVFFTFLNIGCVIATITPHMENVEMPCWYPEVHL